MSALEQPFVDAIAAKQIQGVIFEGRDLSGNSYSNALGSRTLPDESEKPLTSKDILFLASGTKLLTSIAALQCCERGLLSLDEDLADKLPDLVKQGVLVSYDDKPVIKPLQKALTLRHLITHSSGLEYPFMSPKLQKWTQSDPEFTGKPDVPSRYLFPLSFQPGEGWMYGVGLDWAGYLVEQVSGLTLDEYIRENMLKPLDSPATEVSFFPIKEGLGDRMPDLNPSDPRGHGLSAASGMSVHGTGLTGCFGGQGGYATAEAYVSILHSLLKNDGKLLSKESVTEMHKPQLEPAARESFHSHLNGPFGGIFSQGFVGERRDYGLGGVLAGEEDENLGKNSLAWGGGVNSTWIIDREHGVCGYVSPQLGIPADREKAMELKAAFRRGLREQLKE